MTCDGRGAGSGGNSFGDGWVGFIAMYNGDGTIARSDGYGDGVTGTSGGDGMLGDFVHYRQEWEGL